MKKFKLLAVIILFSVTGLFAQRNFFENVNPGTLPQGRAVTRQLSVKGTYRLDEKAMRTYLQSAPMEFKNNGVTIPLVIPLPDGTTEVFNMVESPVLSPALSAANPEIRTYTGNGQKDKKAVIRLSLTSSGFNAVILNLNGKTVYFEPHSSSQPGIYFNYFTKDLTAPTGGVHREENVRDFNPLEKQREQTLLNNINSMMKNRPNAKSATQGGIVSLTTYRLAMAADAEFVAQNGGTIQSGYNAVVAYVNRIIAFYRTELAVNFQLVSGTNVIYTNANTDPYTNSSQSTMLSQNISNLNAVIGVNAYDIGHVWGYTGGSGGGVAYFGSLCQDNIKGGGVSGEGDLASYAQVFQDQLVFHEMGHQFGMSHSYNSSIPVCETREPTTSVEPGSGATVMSYGFTCGDDDYFQTDPPQTGPILNFHSVSLGQAIAYMSTISCGTTVNTSNSSPVVTVPSNYTIPKSTPFYLTGSATDPNNDILTYSWEGTNIGTETPDASTLSNTAKPPFFRSYEPSASPTRYYPLLSAILDGSNYAKGDKLPSVGIVTTHTLTVRDNNAAGGVSTGTVSVTVDGNSGPFEIASNLAGDYAGATSTTVTWSVNNTAAANPNVKISLSTDGGLTFPTILLATTPNDGTQAITWPNGVTTTTARLKIEAVGNIFFDISNVNFSLHPGVVTYNIAASAGANGTISPSGTIAVNSGASQLFSFTPASCYRVANVLVDNVSVGTPANYTFQNVTSAHSISVTFAPITYAITASSGANGSVTPAGVTNVNCGTSQAYAVTPASGFVVQNVLVDNVSVGAVTSYNFTNVTTTHTISATFTPIPPSNFAIAASAGANGTISPNGTVNVASGGSQLFSFTPASCYRIANVLVDNVSVGIPPTYNFTNVTSAHSISVTFALNAYNIVASAGANGSISPAGTTSVNCGASQNYIITPASGYKVADVLVDNVSVGAVASYNFPGVTATHTISVTFAPVAATMTPVYRINAGGPQVTNSIGNFSADAFFSPSPGWTYANANPIAATTDDAMYQTERYSSAGQMAYALPIANGQYTVVLHFAEIFYTAINKRVFDVTLENTKVLNDYDIFKKVGANTATTETFPVTVSDGTLNINFSALAVDGGIDNAKISAIEVLSSSSNQVPVANAGADKLITLPSSSAVLDGSGTDPDGNIASYEWTQVSGPKTATFSSTTAQAPTVSAMTMPGNYVFSLIVKDNLGTSSVADQVTVFVNSTAVYRINAGGGQVTNSIGTFNADQYFSPSPGSTFTTSTPIAGTTDDAMYQTERFGTAGQLSYAFPITNGQYTVVLHFAEIYYTAVNKRVFDVSLEGTRVLDNYDIFKKVGANTATMESFPVTVTDGTLNISLSSLAAEGGIDNAKISAIEILSSSTNVVPVANAGADKAITLPVSSITLTGSGMDPDGMISSYTWAQVSGPKSGTFSSTTVANPAVTGLTLSGTYVFSLVIKDNLGTSSVADQVSIFVASTATFRINAGGTQVTNSIGTFSADAFFTPSPGSTFSTSTGIAGTTDDAIYQTERFGTAGQFGYAFTVPNGQYAVVLHFAEIYYTAVKKRVFDVAIEGSQVLNDYDIFAKAGANTAVTEAFLVNMTDGTLNINLNSFAANGGIDAAKISAIEVLRIVPSATKPTVTIPGTIGAIAQRLAVKVNPNPTRDYASFNISGGDNKPVTIRIYNTDGKMMETKSNISTGGSIKIGSTYLPGMYYGEVLQGSERVMVKFIKLK